METRRIMPQAKPSEPAPCRCMEKKGSWWLVLFKIIIFAIVLVILCSTSFALGLVLGKIGHTQFSRCGMMSFEKAVPSELLGDRLMVGAAYGNIGMAGEPFIKYIGGQNWGGEADKNTTKVFGVITKIDGNKITVLDNGAKEQVIVSLSDTAITSPTGEVGLGSLKVDESVTSFGAMNKDNQLEAKMIQVWQ